MPEYRNYLVGVSHLVRLCLFLESSSLSIVNIGVDNAAYQGQHNAESICRCNGQIKHSNPREDSENLLDVS
jgi:hypothetical protein